MAYTGLGSGISTDPFQVTSLAEFKQMNNWPVVQTVAFTGSGPNDVTYMGPNTLAASATFTIVITKTGAIKSWYIPNSSYGGTGYVVGDTFSVQGGTGDVATGRVLTTGSGGQVLTAEITFPGSGYYFYAKTTTTLTGSGTSLRVYVIDVKDGFTWKKDSGATTLKYIDASNTAIPLSDGVSLKATMFTGHTVGVQWVFTLSPTPRWKIMNNIDLATLLVADSTIDQFYGCLDGNGQTLLNAPDGLKFNVKSGSLINNLTIRVNRDQAGVSYYLLGSSGNQLYGVSFTNLHVIVTGAAHIDRVCDDALNADCVINNVTLEGDIRRGFSTVYCDMIHVNLLRTSTLTVSYQNPLVSSFYGAMKWCQVVAPITFADSGGGDMGLLVGSLSGSGSVSQCFVLSNFYTAGVSVNKAIHAMVGSHWANDLFIQDSYFKGNFNINKGEDTDSSYGNDGKSGYLITPNSTAHVLRCYSVGDVNTPLSNNRAILVKEYNTSSNNVQNCYYNKTQITSITPKDIAGQQLGLTSIEFTNSSKFNGWDFTTVWQMGPTEPVLRNNPVYAYELVARAMSNPTVTRNSGTQITVNLTVGTFEGSTYGVDVFLGATLVFNAENVATNAVVVSLLDGLYTIKPYWLDLGVKNYSNIITYQHYVYSGAIDTTTIAASAKVLLHTTLTDSYYVHGSLIYNGYIYGSDRNRTGAASKGCITKAPVGNIAAFVNIPIYLTSEGVGNSANMDQILMCGAYLYALGDNGNSGVYLIQLDPSTNDYKVFLLATGIYNRNIPIISDGEYLYISIVQSNASVLVHKVDPSIFISGSLPKFNTASLFTFAKVATYDDTTQGGHILGGYVSYGKGYVHTAVVDSNYIYLGYTSPGGITDVNGYSPTLNKTLHELQKVDKHTMLAAGWVYIPKATDDMCQTDTHCFCGYEIQPGADVRTYGYGWGTFAIRKSDLRLTALPKLHSNDVIPTTSYGSLIFGNYLLDTKTNNFTYVLDISDVDNWVVTEPLGKRTLKAYNYTFSGVALTLTETPNELLLGDNGKFYEFLWVGANQAGPASSLMEVTLTDLSYFAPPTVNTIGSVVTGTDVAFTGYVLNSGGHAVTSKGFRYGTSSGALTSSITSAEVTLEFHGIVLVLPAGTYYYQAYAISSEGESVAEIKSFSVLNTIPFYVGPSHVQAIYLGATKIL